MSYLPGSWREVTIDEVCEVNPRDQGPVDASSDVSFVPMPAVSDTEGEVIPHGTKAFSSVSKGYTRFRDGDVIFAKITPCMENGKIAVAKGLHGGMACGSTEFHVLRPGPDVLAEYVWRFLRQDSYRSFAAHHMTGAVGQRRVPVEFLKKTVLPLPPLSEQRRILANLDSFLARSKSARGELSHISKLTARYKQSVLGAAFRGLLTESWRSERLGLPPIPIDIADQAGGRRHKRREAASELFEPPFEIPSQWVWARLPTLGELDRGRSRHRPRNHPSLYGGPYPFIQTGDVKAARGRLTSFSQTYSETGLAQSRLWPKGTLCITIAANIAETAILGIDACFPDSIVGFTANPAYSNPIFIEFFIRTIRSDLAAFAPATAQKNINLETLGMIYVPCAPLEEQREVVERIEAAFSRVDRVAKDADRASDLLLRLDQAVLAKAFRAALIPRDAADERVLEIAE